MDAKAIVLLGCFLLSAISPAWCEDTEGTCAFTAKGQNSGMTNEQPDPYKDVTWDKVIQKNQSHDQTVTVYTPKGTGEADFVSVTSTGPGSGASSSVVVAAPQSRRAKRWFFW